MFGGLGIWELLIIFFVILLFFGAKRLPEIGGSLGKGIREFKDSLSDVGKEARGEISAPPQAESNRTTANQAPINADKTNGSGG